MIDLDNIELSEDNHEYEKLWGKLSMGKTTFECRNCQTVTEVENLDLEKMTQFRCSGCGMPMDSPRFARLKMLYYAYLVQGYSNPVFAKAPEMFRVEMDFNPHYERQGSENEPKHEESDG